ncbi:hypothetical protein [Mycobacterium intracellulare]|uniref:hypothetical protein n=1 Tax=Mycobacterium intracellulare TaxID=1767 RepID=UPI00080BE82A|nr:hypothetical protein [Mycobacterium intracellulare]OCB22435.1 hypothetical protein A5689_17465 [Mycobacterium intracellulare subsp. yongonense]
MDLYADKFVQKTDVDTDRLSDPARSTAYAEELLRAAVQRNDTYLRSAIEQVADEELSFPDTFYEDSGDERA